MFTPPFSSGKYIIAGWHERLPGFVPCFYHFSCNQQRQDFSLVFVMWTSTARPATMASIALTIFSCCVAETLAVPDNKGNVAVRGLRLPRWQEGCVIHHFFQSLGQHEKNATGKLLVPLTKTSIPLSLVLYRVPEGQLKSIVWQTLQAVNFCHKHNVSIFLMWYFTVVIECFFWDFLVMIVWFSIRFLSSFLESKTVLDNTFMPYVQYNKANVFCS